MINSDINRSLKERKGQWKDRTRKDADRDREGHEQMAGKDQTRQGKDKQG